MLHLGNALAFGAAWLSARSAGGRLLLRVEDLDRDRAREDVANAQREDLRWLGVEWDEEVSPQSARTYALEGVDAYRCDCSRAQRLEGACGCRSRALVAAHGAWRLRAPRVPVAWTDRALGPQARVPEDDPVLVRADGSPGYPLAVVIDDARDGVTEVVRGGDLVDATAAQVVLHGMLRLPVPSYLHVPLLLGPDGRKLGKSHGSVGLRSLRASGWSPERVWRMLLPLLGCEAASLHEGVAMFDVARVGRGAWRVVADGLTREA
jgi:glutamyl-tRNA synthetase